MRRRRMRNKGFTLMEVLISIALVGLLFAPMLMFFSHSAQLNVNAKKMQRVNTVAQSVMEEVRSYDSIASMANVYQDNSNTNLKRTDSGFNTVCTDPIVTSGGAFNNTKYYFTKNNIESDGKKYSARITVDASKYSNLNDTEVPVISSLGSGSTVMALEKDETLKVLYEYQSRYHDKSGGGNIDLNDLASLLKKTLKVEIQDVDASSEMVRVTIYNEYEITDKSKPGCSEKITSANLYNEEVVYKKLKGIYVFYNYDVFDTTRDIFQGIEVNVNYTYHPTWTCDYTLYAVCQKVFSVNNNQEFKDDGSNKAMTDYGNNHSVRTKIVKNITIGGNDHSSNQNYIPVFSNFKFSVQAGAGGVPDNKNAQDMNTVVKTEKIQRLAKVTVEIYEGSKKCTEITSTRGE